MTRTRGASRQRTRMCLAELSHVQLQQIGVRKDASLLPALVALVLQFQVPHPGAHAIIKSGDAAGIYQCQHVVGAAHQALSQ